MSARKPIGSIYLDSSAFIPLLETTHALHNNRASEFVFEDKHFAQYPTYLLGDICGFSLPKFTRLSDLPDVMVQTEIPGLDTEQVVSVTLKQEGQTNP